jgi:hypothetical protein
MIGEPLAILISSTLGKKDNDVIDGNVFSFATKALIEKVDEDQTIALIEEKILLNVDVFTDSNSKRPVKFNLDFVGGLGHLFKVVQEVLKFQYDDDFFGVLLSFLPEKAGIQQAIRKNTIKAK